MTTRNFGLILGISSFGADFSDRKVRESVLQEITDMASCYTSPFVRTAISKEAYLDSNRSFLLFSCFIDEDSHDFAENDIKAMFYPGRELLLSSGKFRVEHILCGNGEKIKNTKIRQMEMFGCSIQIKSENELTPEAMSCIAYELTEYAKHKPTYISIDQDVIDAVSSVFSESKIVLKSEDYMSNEIVFSGIVPESTVEALTEYLSYRFKDGMKHLSKVGPVVLKNIVTGDVDAIKQQMADMRERVFDEYMAEKSASKSKLS